MRANESRTAWWSKTGNDVHTSAYQAALRCVTYMSRRDRLRAMRTMYRGGDLYDPSLHKVTKNAVDTLVARIGKSEVSPRVRAEGMRRSRSERAKALTMWLRGQLRTLKGHKLARRALRDSVQYGTGALHVFRGLDDSPEIERVWVGDLGVEPREGADIRTLYRALTIDRAVAIAKWPKHAAALRECGDAFRNEQQHDKGAGDPITLMECWRLTTGTVKGRHVICGSKVTIVNDEWDSRSFPLCFHHFVEDTEAFWGIGMVESMAGEQMGIDRITRKIEECYDMGGPKILIDTASDVVCETITNTPYECIKYTTTTGGQPPQWISPPAISSDYRMQQEALIGRAYQMAGVDRMGAQSQKPAGLNSAIAVATFSAIESERFYQQTKDFEELVVEVCERLIEVAEDIAGDKSITSTEKIDALCMTPGGVRLVRFDDARLPTDKRVMEVEAASRFSTELAGRLGEVDTLRQMGLVKSNEHALELLDDPNLRRYQDLETSGRHVVEIQVERCLSGKPQTPDPSMPLDYALDFATRALHQAILEEGDGEDDEEPTELDTLRGYIADVQTLLDIVAKKAAEQAAQAMPAPMPQPGAPPPEAMGPLVGESPIG